MFLKIALTLVLFCKILGANRVVKDCRDLIGSCETTAFEKEFFQNGRRKWKELVVVEGSRCVLKFI